MRCTDTDILQSGRSILGSAPRGIKIQDNNAARIPYQGSVRLDSVSPGRYTLMITVPDPISGATSMQQTDIFVD